MTMIPLALYRVQGIRLLRLKRVPLAVALDVYGE